MVDENHPATNTTNNNKNYMQQWWNWQNKQAWLEQTDEKETSTSKASILAVCSYLQNNMQNNIKQKYGKCKRYKESILLVVATSII